MSDRGAIRFMSILCVLVVIPAWLSISNHCALGAVVLEKPKVEHSGCPFHARNPSSGKEKPKPNGSPCCKILRAVAFSPVKSIPRKFLDLPSTDFSFVALIPLNPPKVSVASWALDTGPPGRSSFVEFWSSPRRAPPSLV